MKFLLGQLIHLLSRRRERNVRMLMKFLLILTAMVAAYSILFHFLMILEDKHYSRVSRCHGG